MRTKFDPVSSQLRGLIWSQNENFLHQNGHINLLGFDTHELVEEIPLVSTSIKQNSTHYMPKSSKYTPITKIDELCMN